MTRPSPLLALPASIRHRIYAHVLAPSPLDPITAINYTLTWPHLPNPSNTTFAGLPPLTICTCPAFPAASQHIYTRHRCTSPTTTFSRTPQWLLDSAHGQFNILRPATPAELTRRPHAALLRTGRALHADALPSLYRARAFLLLTGPCPRGRYQAHATQRWLEDVGPAARAHVTCAVLLVQPWEEDCVPGAERACYAAFAAFLGAEVRGLERLVLRVWTRAAVGAFEALWGQGSAAVLVICDEREGGREVVCHDVGALQEVLRRWEGEGEGGGGEGGGEGGGSAEVETLHDGGDGDGDDSDWVDVTTPTDSASEASI